MAARASSDEAILLAFAGAVDDRDLDTLICADNALESHLICFAAEESRTTGQVIDMKQFEAEAREDARALP